jgi:uncharacterized protein YoxC
MTKKELKTSWMEQISIKITDWVGTPHSILVHSFFFIVIFALYFVGLTIDKILLILTTAVSLEAIYLAIFIQMTVNRNTASLEDVTEDIEEIQEDVEDIQEDVGDISQDVDEMEEDVDKIQDQVEEMGQEEDTGVSLETINQQLQVIMQEIEALKKRQS